jgi:hypothetical protein
VSRNVFLKLSILFLESVELVGIFSWIVCGKVRESMVLDILKLFFGEYGELNALVLQIPNKLMLGAECS